MRQVSLKGLLEFTAGCGFLFAIGPGHDFVMYGLVFVVLAVWSLRATHWAWRLALVHWMGAASATLFGMASLEHAFLNGDPTSYLLNIWLWCGFTLIVASPLAVINGCLFAAEAWSAPRLRREP